MLFPALADNLAMVREDVARVQAAEGLRGPVRIVAVTKGHPPEAVREAAALGLGDIGENRVQEALNKQAQVSDAAVTWHLIGHLQTNKAKFVPGRFGYVHSVDSVHVAEALARAVRSRGVGDVPRVLLQVNVAGESRKSGCCLEDAGEIAARVAAMPEVRLVGLMTMAPFTDDVAVQRRTFARLRELRDRLRAGGLAVPELSMGMSGDYCAAVAEGATMLRLGTILFGERPQ